MIIDGFAGPGGWDLGLRACGREAIGIEKDAAACATRAAAGLRTIRADMTNYPLVQLGGMVDGLILSPPCPDFSAAGLRAGIAGESGRLMAQVLLWVEALAPLWVACEQVPPALDWWEAYAATLRVWGYRTWVGILNAADFGVPQTRRRAFLLAHLERQPQPPHPTHDRAPMQPLFGAELKPWVSMAEALGWQGSASAGFARRDDRGDSPNGYRERDMRSEGEPAFALTEKARSWVVNTGRDWKEGGSRADAQEVPLSEPAPTLDGDGKWQLRERQAKGTVRGEDEPAMTITASADNGNFRFVRAPDEYRPPNPEEHAACPECGCEWDYHDADGFCAGPCGGGRCHGRQFLREHAPRDPDWPHKRPATTVAGDPRIAQPGHKNEVASPDSPGRMEGAIRLGIRDALLLQSFPADFPVQGTKTKQFEQVGNAVPPLLAAAILKELL